MALTPWKKLSVEVLQENPYWRYCKAKFIGPTGKELEYFFCETKGAAQVIAVDKDGKLPLVKQFRPLFGVEGIEFPMGGTNGEDPRTAALREFAEEAKLTPGQLEHVGKFSACNGILTEVCDVFVAWDLEDVRAEHDAEEEFEHLRVTPEEVDAMIADGRITHGMCIAGWHLARPKVMEIVGRLRLGAAGEV